MAASQDKVQAILESLLEDSLPLVHKGIFTTEELRHAMCLREKHENNMLKPTYKLSDYLTAIEFEYELERERKFRIEAGAPTNPLFKKQAKTDFVSTHHAIQSSSASSASGTAPPTNSKATHTCGNST